MAFISSAKNSSGKEEVNTASIPTAITNVSPTSANIGATNISQDTACAYIASQSNGSQIKFKDFNQIDEDDIEEMDIKWNMALLSMRPDRYWKRTGKKITIQGTDVAGFDKSKDWSYMANEQEDHALVADEEAPTEFALMAKTSADSEDLSWTRLLEFADDTVTDYSMPSPAIESTSDDLQNRNPSVTETGASPSVILSKPFIKFVKAADRPTEDKTAKVETVKKPTVKYAEQYRKPSKKSNVRGNQRNWNNLKSQQLGENFVIKNRACFNCGHFDHLSYDCRLGVEKGKSCPRNNNTHKSNISYLSDYEPFDGGYVSFGQGGCKITGKGTIKTGKLEFENVYFVKDLKYNLFSVSQICHNKNSVLFTGSECIVLGRDFKPIDDTNVLLRTPRQHNMYSIDLNNIVPHKDLTCLVAKAFADECMLWHRRLGHLNFKTMNRFTWTFFLKTKDETSGILRNFITEIENLKDLKAEAVNTACYVKNRVFVNKSQNKTPYELFNGRTPAIGFLKPFVCRVMILKTLNHLGKFDAKGDEGYFIGYSMSSKAFRVFNKRTKRVEENLHVDFLENKAIEKSTGPNWLFDIDSLTKSMNYVPVVVAGTNSTNFSGTKDVVSQEVKKDVSSLRYIALPNWVYEALLESSSNSLESSSTTRNISKRVTSQDVTPSLDNILTLANRFDDIFGVTTSTVDSHGEEADVSNMETTIIASPTPTLRIHKDHPKSQIIGPVNTLIQTRNKSKEIEEQSFITTIHQKTNTALLQFYLFSCFLSQVEPKKISDALQDPSWVEAMQEELLQFKIQNVWSLVDCPKGFPGRVYKVEKAMYGLHQAPRAWYGTLSKYLLTNGFQRGIIDQTLFIRRQRGDFILVLVYVDDIIFGSSNLQMCREFEALMHEKFQMSAMGELNFFLGLQVLEKKDDIFLSQDKYVSDILKKFRYSDVRSANTPMDKENPWGKDRTGKDVDLHLYRFMIGSLMYLTASTPYIMFPVCACARHQVTPKECHLHAVKRIFRYLKGHPKLGFLYPKESPFDLVAYLDSDYGDATQNRKSTTGGC
nr:putative ribonuclease H-like domain-containing protein [Tanacetum cinerariifolium]